MGIEYIDHTASCNICGKASSADFHFGTKSYCIPCARNMILGGTQGVRVLAQFCADMHKLMKVEDPDELLDALMASIRKTMKDATALAISIVNKDNKQRGIK